MKILITGIAGFIGFHLAKELEKEHDVYGIDSMTDFYDVKIKENRFNRLRHSVVVLSEIENQSLMLVDDESNGIDLIIHLAAQAGVPYSKEHPEETIKNNVLPTVQVFEYARELNIPVIYASSSSVYECKSLYALTKKWNEETAVYYSDVNSIGLRFFSVYGDYGRPDQVFYKWIELLKEGKEIQLNGTENQIVRRNFTHVTDVVKAIKSLIPEFTSLKGFSIVDIKNVKNVSLLSCIELLEKYMGVTAKIKRGDLENYDPLNVVGQDYGFEGLCIADGLKQLTRHLGVYNGSKST